MAKNAERSTINQALAKAMAYRDCGKPEKAAAWAARLAELLDCAGILTDDARTAAASVEG